jgi:hypothetical protein
VDPSSHLSTRRIQPYLRFAFQLLNPVVTDNPAPLPTNPTRALPVQILCLFLLGSCPPHTLQCCCISLTTRLSTFAPTAIHAAERLSSYVLPSHLYKGHSVDQMALGFGSKPERADSPTNENKTADDLFNNDAESGGSEKQRHGNRLGPSAGLDSSEEESITVGKQIELEAGNAIQYRTCSWQKVGFFLRPEHGSI